MYYFKYLWPEGPYIDNEGLRCGLAEGTNVDRSIWTWFDTLEECLEAWHLTYDPLSEPEPEN